MTSSFSCRKAAKFIWVASLLFVCLLAVGPDRSATSSVQDFIPGLTIKTRLHRKSNPNSTDWDERPNKLQVKQINGYAAPDGHILWTLANLSWLDFVLNWVAAVNLAGIDHFFVATMDDRLFIALKRRGIPCVALNTSLGTQNLEWGSDAFKQRGVVKIQLIEQMLEAGLHPLFSDLDVVWLRNPLPFFQNLLHANMLVSTDSCNPKPHVMLDDCPSLMQRSQSYGGDSYIGFMNVGIHLLRPSALEFVQSWRKEMLQTGEMEQACWNKVFLSPSQLNESLPNDPYCRAMDGKITAGLLPAALFQNGHTYFVQRMAQNLGQPPYAVHASFIGGREMKMHHFREALIWHVDKAERFGNRHKLLTIELDLPNSLLQNAGPPETADHDLTYNEALGHIKLVQHQVKQLMAAAELARLLKRVLVMPKLWCGLENLWAPHKGRIWDSTEYLQPAPCTMSQIYDVEKWNKLSGPDGFLPPFLESSYLRSSRVHLKKGEQLTLEPCLGNNTRVGGCSNGAIEIAQPDTLQLAGNTGKQELLSILRGQADTRLIKVAHVLHLWPTELNSTLFEKLFNDAYQQVLRPWCCLEGGKDVKIVTVPNHCAEPVQEP